MTGPGSQGEETCTTPGALLQLALPLLLLDLLPVLEGVHLVVVLPRTNTALDSYLGMSLLPLPSVCYGHTVGETVCWLPHAQSSPL